MSLSDPRLGLVAFQLLDSWGGRPFWKPAPRLEFLLAGLGFGFESLASSSLASAKLLAGVGGDESALADLAEQPRTARLAGVDAEAAVGLLRAVEALSLALLEETSATVAAPTRDGGSAELRLEVREAGVAMLSPWPLVGPRMPIHLPASAETVGRQILLVRRGRGR